MGRPLIKNLLRQLRDVQEGGLWLNESFKNKIDKLTDDEALSRPIPQIHSVAELVSHILEWRKECMLRLSGVRTDLMNSTQNWKDNDTLSQIGWRNLKTDFYESQSELIHLVENLDDAQLEKRYLDTNQNIYYLIEGIIHHDLYHLGQIGITIKLLRENSGV